MGTFVYSRHVISIGISRFLCVHIRGLFCSDFLDSCVTFSDVFRFHFVVKLFSIYVHQIVMWIPEYINANEDFIRKKFSTITQKVGNLKILFCVLVFLALFEKQNCDSMNSTNYTNVK